MDKDYKIVATFLEGSIIAIVEQEPGQPESNRFSYRIRLGEFNEIASPLRSWEASNLAVVMQQVDLFLENPLKDEHASQDASSSCK
jgi:hypothetical protein